MAYSCTQIIRGEHAALGAVLRSLMALIASGPGDEPERYFDLLRAVLFYVDEFPERGHHPKESALLFPRLVLASPELEPVVRRLEAEHLLGEGKVRELQHLLLAWEFIGDSRRAAFAEAARKYVDFYFEHMRVEEAELLPSVEKVLSDADLQALDAAFSKDRDPLAGGTRDPSYDRLFTRILLASRAPASVRPAPSPATAHRHEGPSVWHEPHA